MVDIPLQGTPGFLDTRNPTLLPNFDTPYALGSSLSLVSSAGILSTNPRTAATATATVGGTVTTGDEITIELANSILPGGMISQTYTTQAGDTVATIASEIASLFNANTAFMNAGIEAGVAGAVITFNHSGPIGNLSVLSSPLAEPAQITVGGTALTGDSMYVEFTGPSFSQVASASDVGVLSGTPAAGDTVPLTITNSGVSTLPVTVTYTVLASDTLGSIAEGIAALVNGNATLSAAGITATAEPTEITVFHNGAIGNGTTLSSTPTHGGGGSEAIAFANSGALSGGLGVPGQNGVVVVAPSTTGNTTTQQATALAAAINANKALAALSVTATSSAAVVSLTVPAAVEPATIAAWVNTTAPTITIGGTVAAGNVMTLTFTGNMITGSPVSVTYTCVAGDTDTTVAAGLAAAINADAALDSAGFSASSASGVITVNQPITSGQVRYTGTTTGSETITVPTTPTDTLTVATRATETVTLNPNTGALSGGNGPVIAVNNFNFAYQGQTQAYFYGKPYNLGWDMIKLMVTQGIPII